MAWFLFYLSNDYSHANVIAFYSCSSRQWALDRIKQIQLETMNSIRGAHTVQDVHKALLQGIEQILKVNVSIINQSFNDSLHNFNYLHSKFDARLREKDVANHIVQTET